MGESAHEDFEMKMAIFAAEELPVVDSIDLMSIMVNPFLSLRHAGDDNQRERLYAREYVPQSAILRISTPTERGEEIR
jgi:hypothetical protein